MQGIQLWTVVYFRCELSNSFVQKLGSQRQQCAFTSISDFHGLFACFLVLYGYHLFTIYRSSWCIYKRRKLLVKELMTMFILVGSDVTLL